MFFFLTVLFSMLLHVQNISCNTYTTITFSMYLCNYVIMGKNL